MDNIGLSQKNYVTSEDMGFLYGFSLFETFYVNKNSKVFLLEKHIDRLLNSLLYFNIQISFSKEEFINFICKYIKENKLSNNILRLTVSAGNKQKGIAPEIHFSVRSNPYTTELIDAGCKLQISNVRKSESSILLKHKTSNYLENYYLLQKAINNNFDDCLLLNSLSKITETTKCNIFFVKNKVLHTPDIEAGVLPGIIRNWVMKTSKQFQISSEEGFYNIENLYLADEIFITNSALGIMHVKTIEAQLINNGEAGEMTTLFKKELYRLI